MNARQNAAFAVFRRVLDFLDRYASRFTKANLAPQRRKLEGVVERLTELETEQAASPARRSKDSREARELVDAVRLDLYSVTGLATMIPQLSVAADFRVPNSNAKIRDVIVAARAIAKDIDGHEDALRKAGGSRLKASELRAAADALEAYESAKKQGVGLGDEVQELIKTGMDALDIIESLMRKEITPAIAAEWKATRALGREHRPATKEKAAAKVEETTAVPTAVQQRALTSGSMPLLPLINKLETWVMARLAKREPEPVDADYTVEDITPIPKR